MTQSLDLNQFGLVEMNTIEMKEIDGGFLMALAVGYAILAIDAAMGDPGGVVRGFRKAMGV